MKWNLTLISEELPEQNTKIQQDVLVGRHEGCDLVLQDAKVSRKHAIFSVKKTGLWLEDLQSSNGTYVNGEKIEVATQLNGDEKIQFAELVFQLEQLEDQVAETENPEQSPQATQTVEPLPADASSLQPKVTEDKDTSQSKVVIEDKDTISQTGKKNNLQTVVFVVIAFIIAMVVWALFK